MDVCRQAPGFISSVSPRSITGFSLIEVLITLLITSVGLLSLSALQIQGLRTTHSAVMRTHAAVFATEMSELVRVSAEQSQAFPLDAIALDPTQLQDWQTRIQMTLPEGAGTVADSAANTRIGVAWNDHGTAQQITVSLAP